MKKYLARLNKAFENRVRLGIMSVLVVNDWVEYSELKETLDLTDGNLASHISNLSKKNYVEVRKRFVKNKPNTAYRATQEGRKAFSDHLDALEKLLKSNK
ncbi:winged helix-turn-helix domain-containing protein [Halocola ammonii]